MTPLILKFFLDKLVWFKYSSSLMKGIYVIPVAVAWGPVPVLATSYWFCCCCCCCGAIPFSYVTSSGACCSCWLVRALFSCCFLELRHVPHLSFQTFTSPQTSPQKTANVAKLFCILWFLIHIFHDIFICFLYPSDQLFFDIMSGLPPVFILSCVNVRINSPAPKFWQTTIDSEQRFFQVVHFAGQTKDKQPTDQNFPELDFSIQLHRALHENIRLVGRFHFTTVTSN